MCDTIVKHLFEVKKRKAIGKCSNFHSSSLFSPFLFVDIFHLAIAIFLFSSPLSSVKSRSRETSSTHIFAPTTTATAATLYFLPRGGEKHIKQQPVEFDCEVELKAGRQINQYQVLCERTFDECMTNFGRNFIQVSRSNVCV